MLWILKNIVITTKSENLPHFYIKDMGKNNCLLSCSSAAAARPASIYDCSENGEENDVPIKSGI